jgi:hypothetical protein
MSRYSFAKRATSVTNRRQDGERKNGRFPAKHLSFNGKARERPGPFVRSRKEVNDPRAGQILVFMGSLSALIIWSPKLLK